MAAVLSAEELCEGFDDHPYMREKDAEYRKYPWAERDGPGFSCAEKLPGARTSSARREFTNPHARRRRSPAAEAQVGPRLRSSIPTSRTSGPHHAPRRRALPRAPRVSPRGTAPRSPRRTPASAAQWRPPLRLLFPSWVRPVLRPPAPRTAAFSRSTRRFRIEEAVLREEMFRSTGAVGGACGDRGPGGEGGGVCWEEARRWSAVVERAGSWRIQGGGGAVRGGRWRKAQAAELSLGAGRGGGRGEEGRRRGAPGRRAVAVEPGVLTDPEGSVTNFPLDVVRKSGIKTKTGKAMLKSLNHPSYPR
ncbi:uncharacterized protein A4U43_UnF7950 [Asparagus officinalis]|uniref:Uncharacterized protein n=1 Tax=Asparagus officinalis TaxID=4686 RepID=A0A1R3L626_ASPOF|nr:uncharacterized protein A4U43_UnF7950 [Asparagus officinalis]